MTVGTHNLLAKRMYPILHEQYGAAFSRRTFALGSIWPDIAPSLRMLNHNLEDLTPVISRYIQIACHPGSDSHTVGMALGIVCHCVADIFNLAHNSPQYKRRVKAHLCYELRQQQYFSKCTLHWHRTPLSPQDMGAYVGKLHTSFMGGIISYELEWELTVRVCLDLCTGVLCCREEAHLPYARTAGA